MKNVKEQIFFWSPAVKWEIQDSVLFIENFRYDSFIPPLFPRFYFLANKGMTILSAAAQFPDVPESKVVALFLDFVKKRILVPSILAPQELYHSQKHLYRHEYPDAIKYDAQELDRFKQKQLQRRYYGADFPAIELCKNGCMPDFIENRRTVRKFNESKKIPSEAFSSLLSTFMQVKDGNETFYYYASAGGLYPIDIYIFAKPYRIENLAQGVYYYEPQGHRLINLGPGDLIDRTSHFYTNQEIFDSSAFSVFFVYNPEVTMPKYDGMGYFFAALDTGIMVSTFTYVAEQNQVGICSIGDMNFAKIEKEFRLNGNQVFLHAMEVGLK